MTLPISKTVYACLYALAIFLILGCAKPSLSPQPVKREENPKEAGRIQIARLESESLQERTTAFEELRNMGHSVLPLLNQITEAATGELQATLRSVIRAIWATDPLCMVSPPDRRISADIKDTTPEEARRILFADFPLCPPIDDLLEIERRSDKRVMKASLRLDNATYWQAILAYCAAFELELDPGIRHAFGEGKFRHVRWSEPTGIAIVSATSQRNHVLREGNAWIEEDVFTVKLHLEPGFQPIDGYVQITRITDSKGKVWSSDATIRAGFGHHDSMPLTGDRSMPTLADTTIAIAAGKIHPSLTLTIRGFARTEIPIEVESAVWNRKSWQANRSRIMGRSRVLLENFEVRAEGGKYTVSSVGIGEESVPKEKVIRSSAWIIIADDAGHSVNQSSIGVGGTGAGSVDTDYQWSYPEPPTRVCLIRPLESRVIEIPFEIRDVPVPTR